MAEALRRRQRRQTWSDAQVLAAIREAAAAAPGPLPRAAYDAWVAAAPPRTRPGSALAARRFGGWSAAVRAAGAGGGRRRRARPPVDPARALAHLRAAAAAAGAGPVTRSEYERYRGGAPDAPGSDELVRLAGSWSRALALAGLAPHGSRTLEFSDRQLRDALRAASARLGTAAPSLAAYAALRASRPDLGLPAGATLVARAGTWRAALADAGLLADAPAAPEPDAARPLRVFALARPYAPLSPGRVARFADATGSRDAARAARAVRQAAGVDPEARRLAHLEAALVAAAVLDGGDGLSVARYDRVAAAAPGLPSFRTIHRAFGSWGAALARVGLGAWLSKGDRHLVITTTGAAPA